MHSRVLFAALAILLAQFSWAAGTCKNAGSKNICEIQVGNASAWNSIDADVANCLTLCGAVDTVHIVLTGDISFGDAAPDSTCKANVTPVRSTFAVSVRSDGTTPFTLKNGCLKDENDQDVALFVASEGSFKFSGVNVENFYVDGGNAKNVALVLARGDREVNVENVSLKNVLLKSGYNSENTALLVASSSMISGRLGNDFSKVRGEKLSIRTESSANVGGLVAFSEIATTVTYSKIDISIDKVDTAWTSLDSHSAAGGLVGKTTSRTYVLQDTVSLKIQVFVGDGASSVTGGLVGAGVVDEYSDFVMGLSKVSGEVKVVSRNTGEAKNRNKISVGGIVGEWSLQSGAANFKMNSDSVAVNVTFAGEESSNAYVGGVLGYGDALGDGGLSMDLYGIACKGRVASTASGLQKLYSGGVIGGFSGAGKTKIILDSSFVTTFVGNDIAAESIFFGGFAGLVEGVDSLKVMRSFAWGFNDSLFSAKVSSGNAARFYLGGLIGFLNKAKFSEISESFARGFISAYGAKNGSGSANKIMSGIVGLVEKDADCAKTVIRDAYYMGGFDLSGNPKNENIVGLAYASGEFLDIDAAYAMDFLSNSTQSTNTADTNVVATVNGVDKVVPSEAFAEKLNSVDNAWIWSDTLNNGYPQLKFFVFQDGGKLDPGIDPPNPPDPPDPPAPGPVQLRLQVWASGNVAKMSAEFVKDADGGDVGPVYARVLDASEVVVAEELLAESVESRKYEKNFGQLPAGDYSVEVCVGSQNGSHCDLSLGKTGYWKVRAFVNSDVASSWQMVALSSINPAFTQYEAGKFFRWDESEAVGEYWQYKAYDGSAVDAGEGGWFFAASGLNLPARTFEMKSESDSVAWKLQNKYSGWNMVANPYPWNIRAEFAGNFEDPDNGAEPVWYWNPATESYEAVEILPAFGAFWVHSKQDGVINNVCAAPAFDSLPTVKFSSIPEPSPAPFPTLVKSVGTSSWSLRLVLKGEDGSVDRWNVVGAGSKDVSIDEPPAGMERGVNLSIVGNGSARGIALAKSVVALGSGNVSSANSAPEYDWTVALSAGKAGNAKFSVEGLKNLEAFGLKALLDVDGKTYELESGAGVDVPVSAEVRYAHVKVVPAGSRLAPSEARIYGISFVNFGSSLSVSFGAASSLDGSAVEVRLVALDGTVVSSVRGTANAGANSVDLTAPVRSGVYVLRVRAGGVVENARIRI